MEFFALPVFVFLELIKILIFIEIVLSLLSLVGILIAIPFISSIVHPMFHFIQNKMPVQFFGMDFSALILLIIIGLLQQATINIAPEIIVYLPQSGIF